LSGRLFVGGGCSGHDPWPLRPCGIASFSIPSNANVFRWDGTNHTGTLFNANRYLSRRPHKTASQTGTHSNIDSGRFGTKPGAYIALVDPTSGQVIRGKFTFARKLERACPLVGPRHGYYLTV
jgi:hypothetical protein